MKKYVPLFEEFTMLNEISSKTAVNALNKATAKYGEYAARNSYPNISNANDVKRVATTDINGQNCMLLKKTFYSEAAGQPVVAYYLRLSDGNKCLLRLGLDDGSIKHINFNYFKFSTDKINEFARIIYNDLKSGDYGFQKITLPRFLAMFNSGSGSTELDGSYKLSGEDSYDIFNDDDYEEFESELV